MARQWVTVDRLTPLYIDRGKSAPGFTSSIQYSSCTHHWEQTHKAPLPESDITFSLVGEEAVEPFATDTDVMVSRGEQDRSIHIDRHFDTPKNRAKNSRMLAHIPCLTVYEYMNVTLLGHVY